MHLSSFLVASVLCEEHAPRSQYRFSVLGLTTDHDQSVKSLATVVMHEQSHAL